MAEWQHVPPRVPAVSERGGRMGTILTYALVSGFVSGAGARPALQAAIVGTLVVLACLISALAGYPQRMVLVAMSGAGLLFVFGSAATVVLHATADARRVALQPEAAV